MISLSAKTTHMLLMVAGAVLLAASAALHAGAGAVAAVALLFASSHGTVFPLSQFLSACLYGAALIATGSIWAPVA